MVEIIPFEEKDYLREARSRVTDQFKGQQVFDKYLTLLIENDIQDALKQLMQLRSIDTAQGKQLDIIGDIVGQPRELIDTELIEYFGFIGHPRSESYGDLGDSTVGGIYRSLDDPETGNTLLNDEQYRLFIKSKIIKNNTSATPNELLDYIAFVFGVDRNNTVAEGGASFTILVGKELSPFERLLLTYTQNKDGHSPSFIPKPLGVGINYGEFPSENFFAFQGVPGAKGYGDLNDPSVGGRYASLF